ncbi:Nn.00g042110.m01.CDS01 [Neocucurbitaria sp. VM-36]
MSQNPPQTLSVKRKRHEPPVDALVFDNTVKRQKSSQNFAYRRLTKPNDTPVQNLVPPTPTTERRFHLDPVARTQSKHVFIEARQVAENGTVGTDAQVRTKDVELTPESTPRPRKRPGAGSALPQPSNKAIHQKPQITEPSENDVRQLEALSQEVEKVDNLHIPLPPSPPKFKPHPPAQRFAERHPAQAAALASQEQNGDNSGEAMDIDTDEYVYDTYIRETILPDANGQLPPPSGTVGFLVIKDVEDDDWWNGSDSSDKEFDTDDEDENAEDYYANDYPEDELSEDDEFGRDVYQKKYRHGSDDEEFNLGEEEDDDDAIGSGEDEDDLHFKMTVPKAQRGGYWGTYGEPKT